MKKFLIGGVLAVGIAAGAWLLATREAERVVVVLPPGPPQPQVSPVEAGIDPAAIEMAVEYAGKRNSRSLVVARGGHLVYEKHWRGDTLESLVRFDELTPIVTALLTGSVLNDRLIPSLDMPASRYLADLGAQDVRSVRALLAAEDAETLARVLENITGQPFQTLVAERLWKPFGGGNLEFEVRGSPPRQDLPHAACCMRARIADWMRLAQMLARDGVFEANQYTPPGFVHSMLRPASAGASGGGRFIRVDGTFAAQDVAWVAGDDHQRLWVVPSLDLVILRLGSEPSETQGWDEAMIPDTLIRGSSGWRPRGGERETHDPGRYAPH